MGTLVFLGPAGEARGRRTWNKQRMRGREMGVGCGGGRAQHPGQRLPGSVPRCLLQTWLGGSAHYPPSGSAGQFAVPSGPGGRCPASRLGEGGAEQMGGRRTPSQFAAATATR